MTLPYTPTFCVHHYSQATVSHARAMMCRLTTDPKQLGHVINCSLQPYMILHQTSLSAKFITTVVTVVGSCLT